MCPKGFPSFWFSAGFRSRIERRRGEVGGEAQSEAAATHAPRHSGNLFTTTPAPTSGGAVPSPAPGAPLPGGFLRFFGGFAPAVRKDGRAQRAAAAPHAPRHNRNLLTTTPASTSGGALPFPAPRAPLPGGFRRFFGEARRRGRRGGEGWAERRRAQSGSRASRPLTPPTPRFWPERPGTGAHFGGGQVLLCVLFCRSYLRQPVLPAACWRAAAAGGAGRRCAHTDRGSAAIPAIQRLAAATPALPPQGARSNSAAASVK